MGQGTDVELNGQGYMLVPGGYRRTGELAVAAATGRTALHGLGNGLGLAVGDPGGGSSGSGSILGADGSFVGPAPGGLGVEPFPDRASNADVGILAPPTTALRAHGLVQNGAAYVGIGRYLYKSAALSAGSWVNWTQVADFGAGAVVSGLALYADDVLILLGSGADIRKWNTTTSALSTWRTGEKGAVGVGYQGQLLYGSGVSGAQEVLRLSLTKYNGNAVTDTRVLDAPIVRMGVFGGKAAIATRRSLWLMGGQAEPGEPDDTTVTGDQSVKCEWLGDPEPVFSHGTWADDNDFSFIEAFQGRLYTWLGGRVVTWDGAAAAGWTREPVEGTACWGGCVAGAWLIVAIAARDGGAEVWGTDGGGWWKLDRQPAGGAARIWPMSVAGCGARDLLVWRNASQTYDLVRLRYRSASQGTYPAGVTALWASPLLDGGLPGRVKTWRGAGASFAWPAPRGNAASADPVSLTLEASIDGGRIWTTAATAAPADGAIRTLDLAGDLPVGTRSRWVQVRVGWASVLDWAPVLIGVWVEWSAPPEGWRRRRWELAVRCADRQIRRDGGVQARTGQQLAADLWAAWEAGATLAFRDVDFDATGETVDARIAAIREEVARPADAGRWGEGVVTLELVEV